MTIGEWLDKFVPFAAIAIDEAMDSESKAHDGFGLDIRAFLGQDWEEKKRRSIESVVRKALDEMISDRPELTYELVGEDPEELAVALAPSIASSVRGRLRR